MEIVKVIKRKGRESFEAEWSDPKSGRRKRKSLKTNIKRTAERAAAKLEKEILEGTFVATRKDKWGDFKARYLDEGFAGRSVSYIKDAGNSISTIEKHLNPASLQELDAEAITKFTRILSKQPGNIDATGERGKMATMTIAKHLRNMKRMLRWAHRQSLITEVPPIDMPKGASKGKAKGRRVTTEELERMLLATSKVVGPAEVEGFKRLIHGLWLSGLRIAESLDLSWEYAEDSISVDLTSKRPMFLIPEGVDKSRKARLLPMAPEFFEWLDQTPEDERTGLVFKLEGEHSTNQVSTIIGQIGRAAMVFVTAVKPASAHDLRRSFGHRWASLVKPHILQQMMRHANIRTSLEYYVGDDANDVAETVWEAFAKARVCANSNALDSVVHEKTTNGNDGRS